MRVGLLRFELRVMGSRSLKEKRRPLKSLLEKVQAKFKCSAAEIDHQDLHQRAAIGIAVVANDTANVRERLDAIRRMIETNPDAMVLDLQSDIVDGPDAYTGFADFVSQE